MIEPSDPRSEVIRDFHRLYYDGLGGAPPQKRISFLGVETVKCPLDLWIYQEILHRTRPEMIIECGVFRGGTTLYLANMCDLLGVGEIVACDITLRHVHSRARSHSRVTFLEGSSTDPLIHAEIARRCSGRRTMVILDSDHSEAHVTAELRLYGPLVTSGCYLICEDTNVNGHPAYLEFGPGPFEAVQKFLAEDEGWRVDTDCEKLLVTFNPSGYLVRLEETSGPPVMPLIPKPPLTSVILPCSDRIDFTRACVNGLLKHTRGSWELIAVDNGSNDDTAGYLNELCEAFPVPIEVVASSEHQGVSAAFNLGLKRAWGEYLALLDPGTLVTDGWLDQLKALVESDPKMGLAGPMSNTSLPPAGEKPYGDQTELEGFATRWRTERRGTWSTAVKLAGFALLMKRAVLDALGSLDERSRGGEFDDEDLAFRARRAGFTLALAHDLFVHHHGDSAFPLLSKSDRLGE